MSAAREAPPPPRRGRARARARARDLGIPFEGEPGPLNAITDVAGVEVGHTTLVSGQGPLEVGAGPVRTGVTAILPRGRRVNDPVFARCFALNGNGEMTGTLWIEESGFLDGPVLLTNTHSVGVVRDAVIAWRVKRGERPGTNGHGDWHLPVVGETWDGYLSDINGFHVHPEHVFRALDGARDGPVAEGNVGGGTGMISYGWKGGIGTASRRLANREGGHTVGVLAQCNAGAPRDLRIAGVPVGLELPAPPPSPADRSSPPPRSAPAPSSTGAAAGRKRSSLAGRRLRAPRRAAPEHLGSILIVVATDAPLLPHQLVRVAKRGALGYGRTGSYSHHTSGDILLAFSTANAGAARAGRAVRLSMLPNDLLDPIFRAAAEATEEAIVNAMVAAETMTGIEGRTVPALPHDPLRKVLAKYHRLRQA